MVRANPNPSLGRPPAHRGPTPWCHARTGTRAPAASRCGGGCGAGCGVGGLRGREAEDDGHAAGEEREREAAVLRAIEALPGPGAALTRGDLQNALDNKWREANGAQQVKAG